AMACGTPVVTSDTSSLPEVVGEAAITVDPTDSAAITAAMARILNDVPLRLDLQRAGIERAGEFTWQRTARSLIQQLTE
ncbi:MAG: glycosyltransferase, partial [Anaerolineae bacterium]